MKVNPLAGKPADYTMLANIPRLVAAYYTNHPDPSVPEQRVAFGTSGHRGSSLKHSFNEAHILATTLEVLAANDVVVMVDCDNGYTPTPVISHEILAYNRGRKTGLADGIVITPSHNPPEDGGFKYNPPHGGPADSDVTTWIEKEANALLADDLRGVKRIPYEKARRASTTHQHDYVSAYVGDIGTVIDMEAIRNAQLAIGVDPLGGAGVAYWGPITERYGFPVTVVHKEVDPTFRFMNLDWDGKIRMDCSSPYAMAGLIALKDRFDIAFANDTDHDRHGIVTRSAGLMNPNHYLAVAISYLFTQRSGWRQDAAVGKTVVCSSMIDRVAAKVERRLVEVPVGFKWFAEGLIDGALGFGGEESAGASFLRRDGTVWTTDKDGIILDLLAAEMMAKTGRDPSQLYLDLTKDLGAPVYERIDAPATPAQKKILKAITPQQIQASELAGEAITGILTVAPGTGNAIGGLKVMTENGWFAARPSGTEDVYKIYAESFLGEPHLRRIQEEAQALVAQVLGSVS